MYQQSFPAKDVYLLRVSATFLHYFLSSIELQVDKYAKEKKKKSQLDMKLVPPIMYLEQ